jgi:hypothetical protein
MGQVLQHQLSLSTKNGNKDSFLGKAKQVVPV